MVILYRYFILYLHVRVVIIKTIIDCENWQKNEVICYRKKKINNQQIYFNIIMADRIKFIINTSGNFMRKEIYVFIDILLI